MGKWIAMLAPFVIMLLMTACMMLFIYDQSEQTRDVIRSSRIFPAGDR